MKTYNTYQEAKIANPKSEIVTTAPNWEFDRSLFGKFQSLTESHWLDNDSGWIKCHPKDYCMTLAEFLAKGHKLVEGDIFMGANGKVQFVLLEIGMNIPDSQDKNRYILRAKALEQAEFDTTPQQVESLVGGEWIGGIPNAGDIATLRYMHNSKTVTHTVMVKYASSKHCIGETVNNVEMHFTIGDYQYEKPETPQQRQEREELESAYELYCEWYNDGQTSIKPDSFEKFSQRSVLGTLSGDAEDFIRLVRKTKYRKEAK